MVTVSLDDNLQGIQTRFQLTEEELDRAFQRARRRAAAAGYDRVLRQFTRITGESRKFWTLGASRVYSSVQYTGEGKVWVGLNPDRYRRVYDTEMGRYVREGGDFPELATDFDSGAVVSAMEQIFEAELEKAAIAAVSK